jgi:hypothetical protein
LVLQTKCRKSGKSSSASSAARHSKEIILSIATESAKKMLGCNSEATKPYTERAEDAEALNPTILEFCNSFSKLSSSEKQKLTELLTGVPCSDPLKAFRVGDKVAGNRPRGR